MKGEKKQIPEAKAAETNYSTVENLGYSNGAANYTIHYKGDQFVSDSSGSEQIRSDESLINLATGKKDIHIDIKADKIDTSKGMFITITGPSGFTVSGNSDELEKRQAGDDYNTVWTIADELFVDLPVKIIEIGAELAASAIGYIAGGVPGFVMNAATVLKAAFKVVDYTQVLHEAGAKYDIYYAYVASPQLDKTYSFDLKGPGDFAQQNWHTIKSSVTVIQVPSSIKTEAIQQTYQQLNTITSIKVLERADWFRSFNPDIFSSYRDKLYLGPGETGYLTVKYNGPSNRPLTVTLGGPGGAGDLIKQKFTVTPQNFTEYESKNYLQGTELIDVFNNSVNSLKSAAENGVVYLVKHSDKLVQARHIDEIYQEINGINWSSLSLNDNPAKVVFGKNMAKSAALEFVKSFLISSITKTGDAWEFTIPKPIKGNEYKFKIDNSLLHAYGSTLSLIIDSGDIYDYGVVPEYPVSRGTRIGESATFPFYVENRGTADDEFTINYGLGTVENGTDWSIEVWDGSTKLVDSLDGLTSFALSPGEKKDLSLKVTPLSISATDKINVAVYTLSKNKAVDKHLTLFSPYVINDSLEIKISPDHFPVGSANARYYPGEKATFSIEVWDKKTIN